MNTPAIQRAETAIAAWGAVALGALTASHTVLRPARDALVLDGNPDQIPWLFTATFLVMLVVSPVWSAYVRPGRRRVLVPFVFHAFAVCALVFGVLVTLELGSIVIGRVFYVWSAVFNMFVASVFWSLLADLIGTESARRLFGPIAAGGTIGAFVGPLTARVLVGVIGVEGVLVASAGLLELAVIAVAQIRRVGDAVFPERPGGPGDPPRSPYRDALAGLQQVARSKYLLAIAAYILCMATAATFLYLEQAKITKAELATRDARAAFFANIDVWTSVGTLVLQTVVAGPLLRRFGPGLALVFLPLAQAAGISVVALAPSLGALVFAQVTTRALTHGLTRPARELLFTTVPADEKYRAKNAIDTIGYRFGDVGSAWLYAWVDTFAPAGVPLVAATGPVVIVWVIIAGALGVMFHRRTAREKESP